MLKNDPTGSGRLLIELLDMTSVITANVQVEKENNKKGGEDKSKNGHQEKMANGITIGTNYRVYAVQKVRNGKFVCKVRV